MAKFTSTIALDLDLAKEFMASYIEEHGPYATNDHYRWVCDWSARLVRVIETGEEE